MASLHASNSTLLFSSSSSSRRYSGSLILGSSKRNINAAIHVPKYPRTPHGISISQPPTTNYVQELIPEDGFTSTSPSTLPFIASPNSHDIATIKMYAILEAVADRVEMHANVGEQRDNWNALLLNSLNMITLTATTMVGINGGEYSLLALNLSSSFLFLAATGMLLVMNKIQPSQLAEEQRNASRLFKQLQNEIQTLLALGDHVPISQENVEEMMEKVLALDRAYPLPLLGVMLEKFPEKFDPAVWWPRKYYGKQSKKGKGFDQKNEWSEEIEMEMREVVEVIRGKDKEDYERLGKIGLKLNKILAISGPVLTGIAAVGSALVGSNSMAAIVGASAGALATIVNTLEHGGQVGMVLEMYRNCAGFFQLMEETIESTLKETDLESRENGELFEMKLALQLGRSLSQLKDITRKSSSFRRKRVPIDEFASKLF